MKKFLMFFAILLFIVPLIVLAQDTEIDVQAYLNTAGLIFMTGIGGMAVMALVEIAKRILSIIVSAGATLVYEMGKGFDTIEFIVLTALVALAANGIYLFPKKT